MSGPVSLQVYVAGRPFQAILSTVDPTSAIPTRVWEKLGRPPSTLLQANDLFTVKLSLRIPPARSFKTTFRVYDKLNDVVIGIQDMKDMDMLLDFSNSQVHVSPKKRNSTRRQDDDRHSINVSAKRLTFSSSERIMACNSEAEFMSFRKRRRGSPNINSPVDREIAFGGRSEMVVSSEVDLRSLLNKRRTLTNTIPSSDWNIVKTNHGSETNKTANSPGIIACVMTPPDEETLKDEEEAEKSDLFSTEDVGFSSSQETKSSWDTDPEAELIDNDEKN